MSKTLERLKNILKTLEKYYPEEGKNFRESLIRAAMNGGKKSNENIKTTNKADKTGEIAKKNDAYSKTQEKGNESERSNLNNKGEPGKVSKEPVKENKENKGKPTKPTRDTVKGNKNEPIKVGKEQQPIKTNDSVPVKTGNNNELIKTNLNHSSVVEAIENELVRTNDNLSIGTIEAIDKSELNKRKFNDEENWKLLATDDAVTHFILINDLEKQLLTLQQQKDYLDKVISSLTATQIADRKNEINNTERTIKDLISKVSLSSALTPIQSGPTKTTVAANAPEIKAESGVLVSLVVQKNGAINALITLNCKKGNVPAVKNQALNYLNQSPVLKPNYKKTFLDKLKRLGLNEKEIERVIGNTILAMEQLSQSLQDEHVKILITEGKPLKNGNIPINVNIVRSPLDALSNKLELYMNEIIDNSKIQKLYKGFIKGASSTAINEMLEIASNKQELVKLLKNFIKDLTQSNEEELTQKNTEKPIQENKENSNQENIDTTAPKPPCYNTTLSPFDN